MGVKTYDPKQVVLTVGGVPISGFADGTFINVERTADAFSKVTGADGQTSRAKSNDRSGSITITLQQTSPSNDVLSGFMIADELRNAGVVPVLIKDIGGTSAFFSGQAWVRKAPNSAFSKNIENREWILDCAEVDVFVGGNA